MQTVMAAGGGADYPPGNVCARAESKVTVPIKQDAVPPVKQDVSQSVKQGTTDNVRESTSDDSGVNWS